LQLCTNLVFNNERKNSCFPVQELSNRIIVLFAAEFGSQAAQEYIADFLVKRFHPHTI
jgi:hypothetical protein